MEIVTTRQAGVAVLGLSGNLTAGSPEESVLETVTGLLNEGCLRVVVDLAEVGYVDSAGLGCLVRCFKRCSDADGELRLASVNERLRSILALARLTDIFLIFDDVEAALDASDA